MHSITVNAKNTYVTAIILAFCGIMPWYIERGLYNVVDVKFSFTVICSVMLLPLVLIKLFQMAKDKFSINSILADESVWLLGFLAICTGNIFFSQHKSEAIFGLPSRYNGLILIICVFVVYLAIRLLCNKAYLNGIVLVFIYSAMVQAGLMLINWFWIDPFQIMQTDFFKKVNIFLGTMGNVNFTAAYFCLAFPVALWAYLKAENIKFKLLYGVPAIMLTLGILLSASDGAFFAVVAVMTVIACSKDFSFNTASRLCAFMSAFFISTTLFGAAMKLFSSRGVPQSVFGLFTGIYLSVIFAAAFAALAVFFKVKRKSPFKLYIMCRALFGFTCVAVVSAIVLFTFVLPDISVPGGLEFLRLNDRWGSNRGYVWGRLIYCFAERQSLLHKLIGSGLESVEFVINPRYTEYIVAMNGTTFDSAHNEYIQYLICVGVLGLAAWIGFLYAHFKLGYKARTSTPIKGGLALAVLSYGVQAFFNVSMPVYFVFLFIIAAMCCCEHENKQSAKICTKQLLVSGTSAVVLIFFMSVLINKLANALPDIIK